MRLLLVLQTVEDLKVKIEFKNHGKSWKENHRKMLFRAILSADPEC